MYACFCDDDGHKLISSEYVDALDILSDFPSLEQAMSVRYIQYPLIVTLYICCDCTIWRSCICFGFLVPHG